MKQKIQNKDVRRKNALSNSKKYKYSLKDTEKYVKRKYTKWLLNRARKRSEHKKHPRTPVTSNKKRLRRLKRTWNLIQQKRENDRRRNKSKI